MKTTHQIAKELLALPDVELVIEYWVMMRPESEMVAEMTEYDPNGTAIIWQKPKHKEYKSCKESSLLNWGQHLIDGDK
jgi:hypothetical protein